MNLIKLNSVLGLLIIILLSSCNTGYNVDDKKVSYTYWNAGMGIETKTFTIIDADALTFKTLQNETYAIDKNRCYYKGKPINNADPKSFVSILDYYAKDNFHAFKEATIVKNANGKTFEVINGGPYSKDANDYFFDTIPLQVNDVKSFQILDKVDQYGYWAKDKTHYYKLSKKYPLKDYKTFQVIGNNYAKDKFRVYYNDTIVFGADPLTFKTTEYGFGEDKKSKFDGFKKLNIEDPSSYEILDNGNYGFTKDKHHIYLEDSIVIDADPESFESINWEWSKDRKSYFYHGKLISEIDYNSFQLLDYHYAKDNNYVYYDDEIIEGADSKTFTHIHGTQDGKDKNACYRYGEKVNCEVLLKED